MGLFIEGDVVRTDIPLSDRDNGPVQESTIVTLADQLSELGITLSPESDTESLQSNNPIFELEKYTIDSPQLNALFTGQGSFTFEFSAQLVGDMTVLFTSGSDDEFASINLYPGYAAMIEQIETVGGEAVLGLTKTGENQYVPTIRVVTPFSINNVDMLQNAIITFDRNENIRYMNPVDGIAGSRVDIFPITAVLKRHLENQLGIDTTNLQEGDYILAQVTADNRLIQLLTAQEAIFVVDHNTLPPGSNIRTEPTTDFSAATRLGTVNSETTFVLNTATNRELVPPGLEINNDSPFISAVDDAGYRWFFVSQTTSSGAILGWVREDVAGDSDATFGPPTPRAPDRLRVDKRWVHDEAYLNLFWMLPYDLRYRANLTISDPNYIGYDPDRHGFVDIHGYVFRNGFTIDGSSEYGWVKTVAEFVVPGTETRVIVEFPEGGITMRNYTEIEFTQLWFDRLSAAAGEGLAHLPPVVYLTFTNNWDKDTTHMAASRYYLQSINYPSMAIQSDRVGGVEMVRLFTTGDPNDGWNEETDGRWICSMLVSGLYIANERDLRDNPRFENLNMQVIFSGQNGLEGTWRRLLNAMMSYPDDPDSVEKWGTGLVLLR